MFGKKSIHVGDIATLSGETCRVTELKKNSVGRIVIAWASDHANKQIGVCTQSLWTEWASGANLKGRRF